MTETQFSELHACRLTQVFSGHSDILISVILLSVNFHNIFLHVFLCLFVLFQFLVPGIESRASWMMLRHPTTELEHQPALILKIHFIVTCLCIKCMGVINRPS